MTGSDHFVEYCECGNVLSQCRCPSPDKTRRVRVGKCECALPLTRPTPSKATGASPSAEIPEPPEGFESWLDYLCRFDLPMQRMDLINRDTQERRVSVFSVTNCARAELAALRRRAEEAAGKAVDECAAYLKKKASDYHALASYEDYSALRFSAEQIANARAEIVARAAREEAT